MMATLIEAALRSLLLAIAVGAGLRVFQVRNVLAQKGAWAAVLAGALLMPVVLPLSARWQVLPSESFVIPAHLARVQSTLQLNQQADAPESPAFRGPLPGPAQLDRSTMPKRGLASTNHFSTAAISGKSDFFPSDKSVSAHVSAPQPVTGRAPVSFAALLGWLYFIVAAALLSRLVFGLASTLHLWHAAQPAILGGASRQAADLDVRFSRKVSSPVTIGSGVLLPANYADWDDEKLRIVLAHEHSHVLQRDFYWQILASLYAAVVWFSPLGWWLKRKLADLGEAIGDRAGLTQAVDRSSYAQVLLEFAAAPHPALIGVAMARPSSTSRRIERLLNDHVFRQAFAGGRRAFLVALLAPAALFAFTALVRVHAATVTPQQAAQAQAPITGQSNPGAAPAPAPGAAPAPAQAEPAPVGSPVHVDVPAIHVNVPSIHVDVPAKHIEVPAIHVDVPAKHFDVPAVHVDVPAQHVDVPAVHVNVPAQQIDIPAIHIDVPPAGAQSTSGYRYSYGSSGELYAMNSGFGKGFGGGMVEQAQSELTFDRTLTINGKLDLHVATASGNIHLTRGSASQVVIHGRVRIQSGADEAQAREIAANPPIEQNGNTIRIGAAHQQGTNHISIDYDIEAPADAALDVISGSGNIVDEGVGQGAKLMTGSGNIVATGLQGGFKTQTGSGNIAVNDAGEGDAKAQTGSGNIVIKGVHGSLLVETGSGNINAAGTPSAAWKLEAGSGGIELSPGNAPLTLDASTGSGSIATDRELAMQTSIDHHHLRGQLNGGGPTVRLETGSGDIRIH